MNRVFDLFHSLSSVAWQHVHETKCVLHSLVIVVFGHESDLSGLRERRKFVWDALGDFLNMRTESLLGVIVELLGFYAVRPNWLKVVDSSESQCSFDDQSKNTGKRLRKQNKISFFRTHLKIMVPGGVS